jgi:SAM-dependent methyltransferase
MPDTPTAPRRLTDITALARNRARARRHGLATFLHDMARDEIQERVGLVNRRFTAPAVVSPFIELWGNLLPGALHVDADEVLALEAGAHDLVVHAMALHWFDDPLGQIIQCARSLRQDGLFLAVCPGGRTLEELRSSLAEAEVRLEGGLSPRVMPMAGIRDLGALLMRAGLSLPVADSVALDVSYRDLPHLAGDLRAMGEQNALADRRRRPSTASLLAETARVYSENFPAKGGGISATFELVFLAGWTPHPSQPKPLRPGSAMMRLSDALSAAPSLPPRQD